MGVYLKPKLLLDRRVTKLWVGRYLDCAKFGQACLFAKHAALMGDYCLTARGNYLDAFQKTRAPLPCGLARHDKQLGKPPTCRAAHLESRFGSRALAA